jgi:Zn-dependent protease
VPINSRYFKKPRRDMALVGAAGPISNFLMAILFAGIIKILQVIFSFVPLAAVPEWTPAALGYAFQILGLGVFYNLAFMIFNLIPVPPLDGSRILYIFLPPKYYFGVMKYEQYIQFGLFALLFLTDIVTNALGTVCMSIINGTDSLFNLIFRLY